MSERVAADAQQHIQRSTRWVALSFGTKNVLSILSTLALARILAPAAFGLLALATPLMQALDQLQEAGLGSALIYYDHDDLRLVADSAALYYCFVALGASLLVFFGAPLIADIFGAGRLTDVLRILAIVPFARALGVVPGSLIEREIRFGSLAVVEIAAAIAQVVTAITCAVAGLGVFSLVFGQCAGAIVEALVKWYRSPIRPNPLHGRFSALKPLHGYSRKVALTNFSNLIGGSVDNYTLGIVTTPTTLGLYSQAYRLATLPGNLIGYVVGRALFPVYSRYRENKAVLGLLYVQNLRRVGLLAFPTSAVLLVAAHPAVQTLLGARWLPAAPALQLLAIFGAVKAISSPSSEVFRATGRPGTSLAYGLLFIVVAIPLLVVLAPSHGAQGAATAMFIAVSVAAVPRLVTSLRICEVARSRVWRALALPVTSACVSAALGFAVGKLVNSLPSALQLISVVAAASVGYLIPVLATGNARELLSGSVDPSRVAL